jgi:hypothetical protein
MELSIPRRTRPLSDQLQQPGGALTDRTLAQRLIRRLEAEAQAQPGARFTVGCAPGIAKVADPLVRALADRFGARFSVSADPARPRDRFEVSTA